MTMMLIFGLGYTATRLAARLRGAGWRVIATRREADGEALAFADEDAVRAAMAGATHILSSVPPGADGRDPVLERYGAALAGAPAGWIGYLSSTGVYGDAGGAWVDETAPTGGGRRAARTEADRAWAGVSPAARVFRLPGIYGPGRSALDRVLEGRAHRIDLPEQVFSRIHVDDIGAAILASFGAPAGLYNIADDLPAGQNAVIEESCRLLGRPMPPVVPLDDGSITPGTRAFYAENRRIANGRAKRLLGWTPRFADYRAGLADCYRAFALSATSSPASTSTVPSTADAVQR